MLLATGAVGVVAVVGGAVPAGAAPGDNGNGVGGCIAGTFYGNTTNPRPSGNGVIPSQSPGPFVNTGPNEPPRNDRTRGLSVGEANQLGAETLDMRGRELFDTVCPSLP
jgi:hypothetical protein